jgi:hypothetical protein
MNANTQPLTAEVDQIIADFLPFFIEMTREEQVAVLVEMKAIQRSSRARHAALARWRGAAKRSS